jgi:integrase
MASSWIAERRTKRGQKRFRVLFRTGGRDSTPRYAGSFKTKREAVLRQKWIDDELAVRRVPNVKALPEPVPTPTLAEAAAAWREGRRDVSDGTRTLHQVALNRCLPLLGALPIDTITTADVNALVGQLAAAGRRKETIRKSVRYLAAVLDEYGIDPNPAKGRGVRLPHEERAEINPPTAEHVEAVHRLLPSRYRLPLVVLDATGMRIGELEGLTWGDMDEPRGRWRITRAVSKTNRARWVSVPPVLFQAVLDLCPRDDRSAERRVFQGFGADRFRTALTRACIAAGVPTFSPHDLRHRRVSLRHLAGEPWARIGEDVGQRNLSVTADVYSHVMLDETELDYESLSRG